VCDVSFGGLYMELFKGLDIDAFDESEAVVEQTKFTRYFDAGLYDDVEINAVEINVNKKDSNWNNMKLTLGKEGYHDKNTVICFPVTTEGVKMFNGSETAAGFMIRKLKEFLVALGVDEEKLANLPSFLTTMAKVIGQHDDLVGLRMNVEFGFRKVAHPQFIEKGVFHLYNAAGEIVKGEDGESPMIFDSGKAAVAFATDELGEKASSFPDILNMKSPTTANDLKKFGGKKKTVAVEDMDLI